MGPQVGFQVKEDVRIGLGFDCAVVGFRVVVVKNRRVGRNGSAGGKKERISKKH